MSYTHFKTLTAVYEVQSQDLSAAGNAIARGQSVGNPTVIATHETAELRFKHEAKWSVSGNRITVYYPAENFQGEGVNYLMSVLMGGQCDIDIIESCTLVSIDLPGATMALPGPHYGISGLRDVVEAYDRPLIGGIIKPKIGMDPEQTALVAREMADGGCDFIKDDEIAANQAWCPREERIQAVAEALSPYHCMYAPCITGDGGDVVKQARQAADLGATALHLNIWCGFGTYLEVRKAVDLPLFFQKSGDKVWTTGPFSIDPTVLYQLVQLVGCDMAHIGMLNGYLTEGIDILRTKMDALLPGLPSFSCGMNPEAAKQIKEVFGNDVMMSAGGYLHTQDDIRTAVANLRRAVE